MNFAEKFNYLMELTGSHNSKVARAVNIDASLVSRWRSGSRNPCANQEIMAALGIFFARRLVMSYQKAKLFIMIGDLHERYGNFMPVSEIITLWLKGSQPVFDNDLQAILGSTEMEFAEKMALLLKAGLIKQQCRSVWLLLNLPDDKALGLLKDFFAFTASVQTEFAEDFEFNIIAGREVLAALNFAGLEKLINNSNTNCALRLYELPAYAGPFETVVFALENTGGFAYSGVSFTNRGLHKIYLGSKLEQLISVLKNIILRCKPYSESDMQIKSGNKLENLLAGFGSMKSAAGLQANALFVSDGAGIGQYVKGDSKSLWGLYNGEMLGRSAIEMERSGSYYPSITRMVLESGSSICTMQTTGTGKELFVIGMPLMGSDGKIEYIVNLSSEIKK